ncbi:tyrosine-type recombinase/integrase [Sagittula sp. SSi028]|uniref:tyrosine-type recombinase/integrase n=1 Tax=Sagittula sp. SSi028 TaxID=3400636 RepID=UPI003AF5CB79
MLHQWQGWAGRFAKQTRAAHMAAIRDFEKHLNGKVFAQITPEDAAFYREELMDRSRKPKEDGGLSRSTLTHRASYVAAFFEWLSKQPGHRHLAKLDGWFDLPKGFRAKADEKPAKQYPMLEEAERALATMRRSTLKDRRDRAIFAAAFVTGLREDALITLRRKYIDPMARTARQVGAVMRAKNGKSYVAHWFPRTDAFQEVLCEWVREVDALGLRGDDALFPPHGELVRIGRGGAAIPPMKTASAVDTVFKEAWKHSAETYTPHSARHTLARLGDSLCLTPEKRKAWSQNLGHETETITEQHYGKMSPAEQAEVFEGFDNETSFSVDEMQLALDYLSRRLPSNSPHYEKARDLARRYEDGGTMR